MSTEICWATKERLIEILKTHNQFNPIHGPILALEMGMPETELRSYINSARSDCNQICSSVDGYWWAGNALELRLSIAELSGRVSSMNKAISGMRVRLRAMEKQETGWMCDGTRFEMGNVFDLDSCIDSTNLNR